MGEDNQFHEAEVNANAAFGEDGAEVLRGIARELIPDAQRLVAEIGIEQVKANVAKGLADMKTRQHLRTLTDTDLLALHRRMEADDPALELVVGEIERRDLDL